MSTYNIEKSTIFKIGSKVKLSNGNEFDDNFCGLTGKVVGYGEHESDNECCECGGYVPGKRRLSIFIQLDKKSIKQAYKIDEKRKKSLIHVSGIGFGIFDYTRPIDVNPKGLILI